MPNTPQLPPADGVAPAKKKKSKFKLIMIMLALLLLIGGGGGGAYWFLTTNTDFSFSSLFGSSSDSPSTANTSSVNPGAPKQTTPTQYVSLPTLTINLADSESARYLRVGIDVEVTTPDAVSAIQNQSAKIRDSIIILLSSKTYAQLATADGKQQLKNEIASRINQILTTPRVSKVYFTEFLIQ